MRQVKSIEDEHDFSDIESNASSDNHTEERLDNYGEDKGETYKEHPVDSGRKGRRKRSRRRKSSKSQSQSHVFIGNLPRNTNREEILEHFSQFRDSIIRYPMLIQRKIATQARLTFSSPVTASDAIELLHKSLFKQSSYISVEPWSNNKNKKRHKAIRAVMPSDQSKCYVIPSVAEATENKTIVYVYNLPTSITNNDLMLHFREFGPHIHKLQVIKDSTAEESKRYGQILFTSLEAAQTAVAKLHKSCMPQALEQCITLRIQKEESIKQSVKTKSAPEQKELHIVAPKQIYPPRSNFQREHHNGNDMGKRNEHDYTELESATYHKQFRGSTKDTNALCNDSKQVSLPADTRPTSLCGQNYSAAGIYETVEKIIVLVYNLPSTATEDDVRMHLIEFEPHIHKILLFKDTKTKKESKQFAQVEFTSLEAAHTAVAKLRKSYMPQFQENCLNMRIVKGNLPQPLSNDPVSKPSRQNKKKALHKESIQKEKAAQTTAKIATVSVFVYNVPSTATNDDVSMHFIEFEPHIHKIIVAKDSERESRQLAVVKFTSLDAAQTAVAKLNKSYMLQFQDNRLSMRIGKGKQSQLPITEPVSKQQKKKQRDGSIHEENTVECMENGCICDSELSVTLKEKSSKQSVYSELDLEKHPSVTKKRGKSIPPKEIEIPHPRRISTQVKDPTEQLIGVRVTNINKSVTGDQLMQFLNSHGIVRQYTIMHAPEGKEMYKAVVYFDSKEEADNVITALNDEKLAGKHIHISPLNESITSLANISDTVEDTYTVYVSEIPKSLCKSKLQPHFAKYGKIASIFLKPNDSSAYISYYRLEDAQAALDMNNREVRGSKLEVYMAFKDDMSSTPDNSTPLSSLSLSSSLSELRETTTTSIPPSFAVQIKHLNPATTMENLSKIVEVYGVTTGPLHVINGNPRYAFVSFATLEAANAAISCLHNQPLDGSRLKVKLKSTPYYVATPSLPFFMPPTAGYSVPNHR